MTDAIVDTSIPIDLLRAFPPASVAARLAIPLYTTNLKHFQPLPTVDARKPY
ncbi:MAG TPA: hypothetical protein VKM72_36275 [Thermoanaerobaculia bacterium]|nr:hypothetical protein [Thermoanaerobaculia bacterium]